MSFAINMQELRERASKRAAGVATVATLLPDKGSKVARVAAVAGVPTRTGGNPMLTCEQDDRCHSIQAFSDRRERLLRAGYCDADAEDLAERLVLRDRDADDRRLCVECSHYRAGRCGNRKAAGLHSPEVGRDLAATLQRCEGFAL